MLWREKSQPVTREISDRAVIGCFYRWEVGVLNWDWRLLKKLKLGQVERWWAKSTGKGTLAAGELWCPAIELSKKAGWKWTMCVVWCVCVCVCVCVSVSVSVCLCVCVYVSYALYPLGRYLRWSHNYCELWSYEHGCARFSVVCWLRILRHAHTHTHTHTHTGEWQYLYF